MEAIYPITSSEAVKLMTAGKKKGRQEKDGLPVSKV